ncbi:MAG: hypothetical protein ABIP20_04315 [Chthoniobacteraceae bacterium]
MKSAIIAIAALGFLTACDNRPVAPSTEKVIEKNTTVVTPPEKKVENNTTIINPPAKVEKKVENNTTIINPPPAPKPDPK